MCILGTAPPRAELTENVQAVKPCSPGPGLVSRFIEFLSLPTPSQDEWHCLVQQHLSSDLTQRIPYSLALKVMIRLRESKAGHSRAQGVPGSPPPTIRLSCEVARLRVSSLVPSKDLAKDHLET